MFQGWGNFYFMVGSAAAGLIGLLFVVVTLTSEIERPRAHRGQALYMTPTVVHFAVVLTTSAVALAPGLSAGASGLAFVFIALAGLGNAARSCAGIGRPPPGGEPPHWSDFWMYGAVPAAIYLGLCAASAAVVVRAALATYAVAALLLGLLLVGIRNAWDLVTWIAPRRSAGGSGDNSEEPDELA